MPNFQLDLPEPSEHISPARVCAPPSEPLDSQVLIRPAPRVPSFPICGRLTEAGHGWVTLRPRSAQHRQHGAGSLRRRQCRDAGGRRGLRTPAGTAGRLTADPAARGHRQTSHRRLPTRGQRSRRATGQSAGLGLPHNSIVSLWISRRWLPA